MRTNSGSPRARSSDASCWLAAGCVRPRWAAPSVTEPVRYTATKVRSHSERAISKSYIADKRYFFAYRGSPSDDGHMADVTSQPHPYLHGHHASVLRSHRWRTAENSSRYLIPSLDAGARVLDVGCGPGTITVDLARYVGEGEVLGIDAAEGILVDARAEATRRGQRNVGFAVGDANHLDFADAVFDVVHAHQVLQHVPFPVGALTEMGRVCRRGGIVAARDGDYGAMCWSPEDPDMDEWRALYRRVARSVGGEPDGGRRLLHWARQADFADITVSASTW